VAARRTTLATPRSALERLVADTDFSINSFADAAQRVNTLIAAIDGAT